MFLITRAKFPGRPTLLSPSCQFVIVQVLDLSRRSYREANSNDRRSQELRTRHKHDRELDEINQRNTIADLGPEHAPERHATAPERHITEQYAPERHATAQRADIVKACITDPPPKKSSPSYMYIYIYIHTYISGTPDAGTPPNTPKKVKPQIFAMNPRPRRRDPVDPMDETRKVLNCHVVCTIIVIIIHK